MNRRDALGRVSLLFGGTIVGAQAFLTGCKPEGKTLETDAFTEANIAFLDEVGETILPATEASPGAKAAKIGEFMKVIVNDCYTDTEQKAFMEGIGKLNEAAQEKYEKGFTELSAEQRREFLTELDKAAEEYEKERKKNLQEGEEEKPPHYFALMKQLTLWGYFSSEIGATKALRYIETPGKWEACIPYKKGDKAWAI